MDDCYFLTWRVNGWNQEQKVHYKDKADQIIQAWKELGITVQVERIKKCETDTPLQSGKKSAGSSG